METTRRAIQQAITKPVTIGRDGSERGAVLVEMTLLIALVVIVAIATLSLLGEPTSEPFRDMTSHLDG